MHLTYVVLLTVLQTFPLTWTTKTPLPVALAGSGCAVMHDTVYVIGGRDSGSGRYCTLHIYDPVYDVWDTLAPMSTPRAHVVAAAVNGKMYVFGGWIGSTATNAVEEYDPLTNLWTTKTPMPTARHDLRIRRFHLDRRWFNHHHPALRSSNRHLDMVRFHE
jgi:N-acetylneuraminic acid mutarotase